jgi:hypothetical protein
MTIMKVRKYATALGEGQELIVPITLSDEVTAVLLQEISQILLSPSIPRELIRKSLAEVLIRYQEEQFDSPHSRSELYRTISGASHLLEDMLPHVLDMLKRGSKSFATEVRRLSASTAREVCCLTD